MTNWQFSERLTNDEFDLLLPHLSLQNVFMLEVYIPKKKWQRLITADLTTSTFSCNVCIVEDKLENVCKHLKTKEHYAFLKSNVVQYYHPFYTFGKSDHKLSKGEPTSSETKNSALKEVNSQIKSFSKDVLASKKYLHAIHKRESEAQEEYLISLSMALDADKPKHMFVQVSIPFDDLENLKFCWTTDDWQPALTTKRLTWKSTFTCNICSVICSGIECVNSHFRGYTHKLKQLTLLGLCYDKCDKVTKNTSVSIDEKLSVGVHKDAAVYFRKDLDKWNDLRADDGNDSEQIKLEELPKEILEKSEILEALYRRIIHRNESAKRSKREELYLGHIGVEYVFKILRHEEDETPTYLCSLCEISRSEGGMQNHLLSFEHMKAYLSMHYPDTVRKYEFSLGHMKYSEFRCVMGDILSKIAIAIEKHHGRSLPLTVFSKDYNVNRNELISEVYGMLHANQNHGPSFSNVVSREEIQELKKTATSRTIPKPNFKQIIFNTIPSDKVYLHQASHDPATRRRDPTKNKRSRRKSRSSSYTSHSREGNRSTQDRQTSRSKSISLRQRETSRSPVDNIWEDYRRLLASEADLIERIYEGYRKNPESHPDYEKEWNTFWQQRKQELEREGKYHYSYNFQPEWVQYFKQRIEQLFGDELYNSQVNIRRKLRIPLDAEEMDSSKYTEKGRRIYDSHYSRYDKIEETFAGLGNEANDSMAFPEFSKRSHFGDSDSTGGKRRRMERPSFEDDDSPHRLRNSPSPVNLGNISDNHSNVVYVLRLLTALEDYLGSLGNKVMDVFAKALQLEKCCRGNILEFESKVLTASNCNMLETAMEKLKGILFAGLLDDKKIEAFKRVIHVTTELLIYAEKRGWRKEWLEDDSDARVPNEEKPTNSKPLLHSEKSLTDTLMDFMYSQQYDMHLNDSNDGVACPPPPLIKMSEPKLAYVSNKDGRDLSFKASSHQDQHRQSANTAVGYPYEGTKAMVLGSNNGSNLANSSFESNGFNSGRPNAGPSGFKSNSSRLATSSNELNNQKQINSMNSRDAYMQRPNQHGWSSWNNRN